MSDRNVRWFALAGPLGVVVAFASVLVSGSTAGEKDSGAQLIDYYDDKLTRGVIASFMWIIAAALLVLFAAHLRTALRDPVSGAGDTAAIAAFGGGIVLAVGLVSAVNDNLALISAVDQKDAASARTLNLVSNGNWPIFVTGMSILLFGGGLAVLQSHALARWVGWVGVVAGVIGVLGPGGFVALIVGMLWILVVGFLLWQRGPAPARAGSPDAGAGVDR